MSNGRAPVNASITGNPASAIQAQTSAQNRCVIIVDEALPRGLAANAAAILGITLGARYPELVGKDATDAGGSVHAGIITTPVPVLKASVEQLRALRSAAFGNQSQVFCVDFSELAQSCKTYNEYLTRMIRVAENELPYTALALCGPRKRITYLTGSLPLL